MGAIARLQPDDQEGRQRRFEQIIGNSPALEAVLERVERVATTDSTVLVQGETGTGKELIARAIRDLYYRLNVFPILIPPLRERREDIILLLTHYVQVFARKMGKRIDDIAPETLAAFRSYRWPGNIRELQNLIERAVILSNDGVLPNLLPPAPQPKTVSHFSQQTTLRESERSLILLALGETGWVLGGTAGAAVKLGLKRTTLLSKMKKLWISRPARQPNTDMLNAESRL